MAPRFFCLLQILVARICKKLTSSIWKKEFGLATDASAVGPGTSAKCLTKAGKKLNFSNKINNVRLLVSFYLNFTMFDFHQRTDY